MSCLEVIFSRKSVRHYTGQEVKDEDIEIILRAAMSAPSAVNCQPWEFIIIRDKITLDKLAEAMPYGKMLHDVNCAIAVCGDPEKAHNKFTEYAIIDATLTCQNIMLAAESLGLGSVWTAVYPYQDRIENARIILKIPENIIPLCIIPLGYPKGIEKPKNKYKPDKIHFESW